MLPTSEKKAMSRKEQRKSAKQLKKMQAKAFSQKTPLEQVMRETMGMTKDEKKKRKRKRQQAARKELRKLEFLQKEHTYENDEDVNSVSKNSDDEDENPAKKLKSKSGIVEISVKKGKESMAMKVKIVMKS
uniref:Nucleolar protein 12 n=1 Tax=Caenorhabditis tropicalis TaxID=1561998 RepID=A0A1I7T6W3_9PELO